jgi:hypothetical protein
LNPLKLLMIDRIESVELLLISNLKFYRLGFLSN